jgi:hypothetical protein
VDFDKLYGFASATFAEYFEAFVGTLAGAHIAFPTLRVLRTADASVAELASESAHQEQVSERINPKLFGYVVLSVLFGAAVNSLVGRSLEPGAVLTMTLFLLLSWLVYSSIVFFVCWLLGGKGSFAATVSATIQLLATVFVASTFIGLGLFAVARLLVRPTGADSIWTKLASPDDGLPALLYYAVHVPLLMIYVPLVLRRIHRLSPSRLFLLAVLPPFLAVFGLLLTLLVLTGGRFGS